MLAMLDKPAILVSHSSKEVENLCDKKYHIQRGGIWEEAALQNRVTIKFYTALLRK